MQRQQCFAWLQPISALIGAAGKTKRMVWCAGDTGTVCQFNLHQLRVTLGEAWVDEGDDVNPILVVRCISEIQYPGVPCSRKLTNRFVLPRIQLDEGVCQKASTGAITLDDVQLAA